MKTNITKLFLCILGFIPMALMAQTVVIDGEIRPRVEDRDGFTKPSLTTNDPGISAIQRTRLGMTFTSGLLNTQITMQDSRTFGQNPNASSDATTGIFEAWAEMVLIPGASLKVGRQTLTYDDKRLFSASTWSNTGTSHDMALLKYCINDFQGHIGVAYNNNAIISTETYYTPKSNYRYMGFVWLSKDIMNGLNLSLIGVDEGVQDTIGTKNGVNYLKTNMYHAYTYGGNLKFSNPSMPISALLTAYFQGGKNISGSKMNGSQLAINIDYKVSTILSANIGSNYISGDNNTKDGIQSNFKKLYGTDHSFNGSMEYWKVPLTQGLLDYYAGISGNVNKDLSLEGTFHLFNSEYSGVNKKKIAFGKDLGSELDLVANYKLNAWTSVQAGWSTYFTNQNTLVSKDIVTSSTATPAIRTPQWAYVMFTIRPTFLNSASGK
ncbi:MAG: alginate export family protein [Bacteroidota bacterium]|nr:alginate export family protein [Bacteroidota bacterium]